MKKSMKFLALALVAVMTFGLAANAKAAEKYEEGYASLTEANAAVDYVVSEDTVEKLAGIVADSVASLDAPGEVDPAKSTYIVFRYSPVKVVKYDGEAHGMRAQARKTVGGAYVADAEILYVGMTEDGVVYNSFDKPTEVGFYYAVAMYAGDADNYPVHAYGILVILPTCTHPECPNPECPGCPENPDVDPECPCPDCPCTKPDVDPETPDVDPETPDEEPEAPVVDPETPDEEPEAPVVDPETPDEEPETPVVDETPVEEVEEVTAPVTGDSANFMVYVVMMAAAVVAMVAARRRA